MKILFFIIIPFLTFAQIISITNEGTDLDRRMAKQKALANAFDEASRSFQNSVKTVYQKYANSKTGMQTSSIQTIQKSETVITIVGSPKYKLLSKDHWKDGYVYTMRVTAKFKLVKKEKITKKKEISKVIHKKKVKKKVKKRVKNFRVEITPHNLKSFQKFLFLIPYEQYSQRKFSRTSFSKNSRFYRKYKKYILKFHKNRISKNIKTGKYKIAFLIFDGSFFFRDKKYKTLKFSHSFKKSYSLSNKNFIDWQF